MSSPGCLLLQTLALSTCCGFCTSMGFRTLLLLDQRVLGQLYYLEESKAIRIAYSNPFRRQMGANSNILPPITIPTPGTAYMLMLHAKSGQASRKDRVFGDSAHPHPSHFSPHLCPCMRDARRRTAFPLRNSDNIGRNVDKICFAPLRRDHYRRVSC